jgi:diguanylate cyclase (GGDEF)-like protein/PAS domain S-box-containing protein
MKKFWQLGPVWRISLGLSGLVIALVFILDVVLNVLPDENRQLARLHEKISEAVATQVLVFLDNREPEKLRRTIDQLVANRGDIQSIGVRDADGRLIVASKAHEASWPKPLPQVSSLTHVVVPMYRQDRRWGAVEVAFVPQTAQPWKVWLTSPAVALVGLFCTVGLVAIYFYLKRVMQHLDPSSAVPERVRNALNTLSEGVVVTDTRGTIMLSNQAFRDLHPGTEPVLEGKALAGLAWLTACVQKNTKGEYPWQRAIRRKEAIRAIPLAVRQPGGRTRETLMNCAPVLDSGGTVRGCLMSFNDVSELSAANARLQSALDDLAASRDQIQQQNEELQRLADVDPLTGCLNRRAFFKRADAIFSEAELRLRTLTCIMTDIDHFKSFNDRYGHAVGDEVLRHVAGALARHLRPQDLLCRYGGEEFCILLRDTDEEAGMAVAERIRSGIEKDVGAAIMSVPHLTVTSSFGLADLDSRPANINELIKHADGALYAAKRSGRNRVVSARAAENVA